MLADVEQDAYTTIIFEKGNFQKSVEINNLGLFAKAGEMIGSSSSPLDKISLFQIGYKRKFNVLNKIKIDANTSVIEGEIAQDKELDNNGVYGFNIDLGLSLNNKTGFNVGIRFTDNMFKAGDYDLLIDRMYEGGISYTKSIKGANIKPYLIAASFSRKDIGEDYELFPYRENIGVLFNFEDFAFKPYYVKRMWEEEIGANVKLGNKNFGVYLDMRKTNSTYEFCPDKTGYSIGVFGKYKGLEIRLGHENEQTDYDGEIEKRELFTARASIAF